MTLEGEQSLETTTGLGLYKQAVLTEVQRQSMTREDLDNILREAAKTWEEQCVRRFDLLKL
jgi:hypothetical protein